MATLIDFELLQRLWRQEQEASEARYRQEQTERPFADRVEHGIAARKLSVVDIEVVVGRRLRLWLQSEESLEDLRIGRGQPVRLWRSDPTEEGAVPGVLATRTRDKLAVVIDAEVPTEEGTTYQLDREAPRTTFERGLRAIERWSEVLAGGAKGLELKGQPTTEGIGAVFAGTATPSFDGGRDGSFYDQGLNGLQRTAVTHCLSAREVALVHGPPGTGKTRTLVEVIRQELAEQRRILVTAASNAAVDNLAERLIDAGVPLVRLGHPARVATVVEDHTLDAQVERSEGFLLARNWMREAAELRRTVRKRRERGRLDRAAARSMQQEIRNLHRDARRTLDAARDRILSKVGVVCTTATGAAMNDLSEVRFDLVVVDEATQAPDPLTLIALDRAPRAVLAGDPKQLPPTVIDPDAARRGLARTLFERIAEEFPETLRLLEVQYRMNEAIMRFPSDSMYEGQLIAAEEVRDRTLADLGAGPRAPWSFVDTAGLGWNDVRSDHDPSVRNPEQAERVVQEVERLFSVGVTPASLALI
ncbi:MAG: AAA domain-containing protein, partial [Myxococcota bacterium]